MRSPVLPACAAALLVAFLLAPARGSEAPRLSFEEVSGAAGLSVFRHVGGSTPDKKYIPEAMSGGACAYDFDGDSWIDVFLVNGGSFESLAGSRPPPPHALFRNRGDGTFEDVTARSGIANAGWGMGCVAADHDGDGRGDLYVTHYRGGNRLFRNRGGFRFEDVTAATGTAGARERWNTGATFGDADGDGDLDLFVAGYVRMDPDRRPEPGANRYCQHRGKPVNCGPRGLPGEGDLLFLNSGDGTFVEAAARLGVHDPSGYYGLGAAFLPLEGSRPWLFVANDSTPNLVYRSGPSGMAEVGFESGLALGGDGQEQACMGIAWGDADADGALDLYVTNFVDDYNTLYRNLGGGHFDDATRRARLVQPTWLMMGWGTAFADFDGDGRDDLVVANGHVYPQVDALNVESKYRMPMQVFRNLGGGTFAPAAEGPPVVGRGLALADFWNDGRLGVVVNVLDGEPQLHRPTSGGGGYLGLRLEGSPPNRDAIGARVDLRWPGGRATRAVVAGGSYLSSHDPRLHFGTGAAGTVDLTITWPDGRKQDVSGLGTGATYTVRPGEAPRRLRPASGRG